MLEVLQFIFSSFWIWLGTLILLAIASDVMRNLIPSIKITKTYAKPPNKK